MSEGSSPAVQPSPTCMESVNRMIKLPVVESTVHTATTIYEKVKDFNSITHLACTSAEMAVNKVVEVGRPIASPIVQSLEGPIKKVDGVLCSGLDYVENKVPAVKMTPCKMYCNTKDYVQKTVSPAVEKAYTLVEPAVKTAYEKIEPVVQTAKSTIEPTIEKARNFVEPVVEKYFGCDHEHQENVECQYCQQKKAEKQHEQ